MLFGVFCVPIIWFSTRGYPREKSAPLNKKSPQKRFLFGHLKKMLYICTRNTKIPTMKAKPFVKWVGGKTQLIDQLEAMLPADFDQWENVTYIELLFLNMEKFL